MLRLTVAGCAHTQGIISKYTKKLLQEAAPSYFVRARGGKAGKGKAIRSEALAACRAVGGEPLQELPAAKVRAFACVLCLWR